MESPGGNHPFIDDNKRTALGVCDGFLRSNGYYIDCDSIAAHEKIMGMSNTNSFHFSNLCTWLGEIVRQKPLHRSVSKQSVKRGAGSNVAPLFLSDGSLTL